MAEAAEAASAAVDLTLTEISESRVEATDSVAPAAATPTAALVAPLSVVPAATAVPLTATREATTPGGKLRACCHFKCSLLSMIFVEKKELRCRTNDLDDDDDVPALRFDDLFWMSVEVH